MRFGNHRISFSSMSGQVRLLTLKEPVRTESGVQSDNGVFRSRKKHRDSKIDFRVNLADVTCGGCHLHNLD